MDVRVSVGFDKPKLFNPCADIEAQFGVLDRLFNRQENGPGVQGKFIRAARPSILKLFGALLQVNNPRVWYHLKFTGGFAYRHRERPGRWARKRTERIVEVRDKFKSEDSTQATIEKALVSIASGFRSTCQALEGAVVDIDREDQITELTRYEFTAIVAVVNRYLLSPKWRKRIQTLERSNFPTGHIS